MAGAGRYMAKSLVGDRPAPAARLLHVDRGSFAGGAAEPHEHSHWQIEVILAGTVAATAGDARWRLARGQAVLIPPRCRHGFAYPPRGCTFVSCKFALAGGGVALPLRLAGPAWRPLLAAVAALAGDGRLPAPARAQALGGVLAGVVAAAGAVPAAGGLAQRCGELVDADPERPWSVHLLAHRLGLSAGHASERLRRELGLPLKRWLDARRAAHAARLLTWSDLPVGAVAERLGFPDVFAFSRFFRRVAGAAPSAYRAGGRGHGGGGGPPPKRADS